MYQGRDSKGRGQRGATFLVALLLFLVCSALASVMLVAGSASAGRMSELRETDRAYYAVSSAAELFEHYLAGADQADTANGQVTVVRQQKTTAVTTTPRSHEAEDGTIVDDPPLVTTVVTYSPVSVTVGAGADNPPLARLATLLLFGTPDVPVAADDDARAQLWAEQEAGGTVGGSLHVRMEPSFPRSHDAYVVTLRGTVRPSGLAQLTFASADATSSVHPYALRLTLQAQADVTHDWGAPASSGNTVTTTETLETRVTWRITAIESVGDETAGEDA